MKRRRTAKQHLGDLSRQIYAELLNMTPRQRAAARRSLAELSETNCSWLLYRMRGVLAELLQDIRTIRKAPKMQLSASRAKSRRH